MRTLVLLSPPHPHERGRSVDLRELREYPPELQESRPSYWAICETKVLVA